MPAGASPPNTNIRSASTAAAMPLRAVGIGVRCSQVLVAGSYASFDAKLRE
jgi:hypothetical protein